MASPDIFGWYGLGSMGIGMAMNLQKYLRLNGHAPLRYSNRTLSKGDVLQSTGAIQEDSFEALLARSNVVFTMISDDSVLNELLGRALKSGSSLKGKVWVDTSTVHPETSQKCATELEKRDAVFVASPVFGASPVAAEGKLIFAMAGPIAVIDSLRPYIENVMGRSIINMGEDVRKSSLLKISGNIFVIGFQELVAEAQVFAEKSGLGTRQMEEFIGSMFGPVIESYSKRMTTGAWAPPLETRPGFAVALAAKDASHAISLAKQHGTRLATLEEALGHMKTAREFAGDSLDSASVYGAIRVEAGLPFWSENSRQGN